MAKKTKKRATKKEAAKKKKRPTPRLKNSDGILVSRSIVVAEDPEPCIIRSRMTFESFKRFTKLLDRELGPVDEENPDGVIMEIEEIEVENKRVKVDFMVSVESYYNGCSKHSVGRIEKINP